MLGKVYGWVAVVLIGFAASPSEAFNQVVVTPLEWRSLPAHCRVENPRVFKAPAGVEQATLSKSDSKLRWYVGLWHYCAGLVKLMRLEYGTSPATAEATRDIHRDIEYSYRKLLKFDPSHRWVIEMLVAKARTMDLQQEDEQALQILRQAQQAAPRYSPIYSAFARIYLAHADYQKAADILQQGNQLTGDNDPEIHYFLGLANFYRGDIETARRYAQKASQANYPFKTLSRKLDEYAAKQKSD